MPRRAFWWVAGLLVAVTWVVFAQVVTFDYLLLQDKSSVATNPYVRGLTPRTVAWAFSSAPNAVWQPITWMSLQLDAQLFGKSPAVFHAVNLLLHTANVVLLLTLLRAMTGRFWASALVALVFGVHPLCVEPVAWIAQRQVVLGTTLALLTILAYVVHVQRQSRSWRAAPVALFAVCVLSSPALLVLPLLLVLIDHWPLGRFNHLTGARWLRAALSDKFPFLIISGATAAVALAVMQVQSTLHASARVGLWARLANAVAAYALYARKAVWPDHLAAFYPHPGSAISLGLVAMAGVFVVVTSMIAWRARQSHPYLAFGWFWYLVALVPVLGIVQLGPYHMADRFMYLPLMGPVVALCWLAAAHAPGAARRPVVLVPLCGMIVGALAVRSFGQAQTWRDSLRLFNHAAAITPPSATLLTALGAALEEMGQFEEAGQHYERALAIDPNDPAALRQVGLTRARQGNFEAALASLEQARRLAPRDAATLAGLADVLYRSGRADEALEHLQEAVALHPADAAARKNLVLHLRRLGRYDDALRQIGEATKLDPHAAWAYDLLGTLLAEVGQDEDAEGAFNHAIALDPANAEAHNNLGVLKHNQGYYEEAVSHFREARKLDRSNRSYIENLSGSLVEAGIRHSINDQPQLANESMREALELTPNSFFANHRMARLLAHDRKFKEAEEHFLRAISAEADLAKARPADVAQAHFELGVMLARRERLLEARQQFEKAVERYPEFAAAKAALQRTRMALGVMRGQQEE